MTSELIEISRANEGILAPELLERMDAYWRAANYLSVGQIYLADNPLLKCPLAANDIKRMLLGHWGTTPGRNFIYVHLNRIIGKYDLDMIYMSGPGHGGPAVVANTCLEGTYSEVYPEISRDESGLQKLFLQFSFPGGIPSHASTECPGSIHEGGELGYSLSHAFGAVFDNPDLVVACAIGDGEAETGPLATAWHSNKFLDAASDGAVLPIPHLNGYKFSNPTVPFDMTVLNELDRFHVAIDAVDQLPQMGERGLALVALLRDKLAHHRRYICKHGEDLPEIRHWQWHPLQGPTDAFDARRVP